MTSLKQKVGTRHKASVDLKARPPLWNQGRLRNAGSPAELIREYFALVALVALVIVATRLSSGFFTASNIKNLLSSNAPVGFACVGMTFVIITGAFDLSIGGSYALAAVVSATEANAHGTAVGILLGLVTGLVCGIINGFLVGIVGVNSFIATLGTGSAFSGAAYLYSHNQSIAVMPPNFGELGTGTAAGLPTSVWVLIGLFAAGWLVLRYSVFGRNLYATGGNHEAARLAGIRTGGIQFTGFVLVGVLAALAGITFTSELGQGQANIGADLPLTVISIVVIGGTSLFGGEGGLGRTLIGFLLISVLIDVFDLLALNSSLELVVEGAVLVLTVSLNVTHSFGRGPRAVLSALGKLASGGRRRTVASAGS